MGNYENLRFEPTGSITRITIDRPKVMNALNRATLRELELAFEAIEPGTRVLVITGAGEKSFVAGADIGEMKEMSVEEALDFSRSGHRVFQKLEALEAVSIAEVNGFALGGGCELMLACDFAIASENARFGQPEVALGVTAGFGGTVRLPRRVGDARARQLLYTGETLKAAEALSIGLVNEVVSAQDLRARVDAIAARIAKNAPRAVALTKGAVRRAEETDLVTACVVEQQAFSIAFSTQDQREGMRAFIEKREPRWQGK